MKHLKYTWFKAGLIALILGVLLTGMLVLLQSLEVIEFVTYGKQSIWGGFLLVLTWVSMIPVIIITFGDFTGMAGGVGIVAIVIGTILNVVYLFGIGALFGWLLGGDDYK